MSTPALRSRASRELARTMGRKVAAARRKAEITQTQLANALGLARTSVTNIEIGRQRMLVETLVAAASILRVPPSRLLP